MEKLKVKETPLLQHLVPYHFEIPVEDPDEVGLKDRDQEMMLPHELFGTLFDHKPEVFHSTFCTEGLAEWWAHQDPERMARQGADGDPQCLIPVQLYGDNVAVCKTISTLVMLWKSCSSFRQPALQSLLPASSTCLRHTDRMSLEAVFRVLRWSFVVMASGVWPATDHRGQAWPEGSWRRTAGESGKRLAGEYRALWWESVGDWEWIAATFGFDVCRWYYNCVEICHRCPASTRDGPLFYKTLSYACACFQMKRALDTYLAAVGPRPALSDFDGFDLQACILWDWMHIGPLGFEHKACGACLMELVLEGRFGTYRGEWKVRTGIALKHAFRAFTAWASSNHLQHSHQQFTPANLSVAEGAELVPHLKGKAHNLMVVSKWLASVTHLDNATTHQRNRGRVMWAIACLDTVFSTAPFWLSDQDIGQVQLAQTVFFPAWRALHEEAGDGRWPIIPKMHAAMHILADTLATRRNPSSHWCFAGEHLMGICKNSLGGNYQKGLQRRMLRAALFQIAVFCRDS